MTAIRLRLDRTTRRRQIVDAATSLFAKNGFRGTTTREIAHLANINEALIFRHFPKKDDLYWAVLEARCEVGHARTKLQKALKSSDDERMALRAIAEDILRRNVEDATLARLLFFCALENHELAERYFESYRTAYFNDLAEYINDRVRIGSFRKIDPMTASRAFLGMAIHRFLIHELFGGKRRESLDVPRVARELASLWLDGVRAPSK